MFENLQTISPKEFNERALVKMEGIGKIFWTEQLETHALVDIDLELLTGEYVAIRGPSGCGKSTLLSIIGLMETPTAGDYDLCGRDTTTLTRTQRAHLRNDVIGFVFQNFNLIGELTVLDNVAMPLTYRGIKLKDRREAAMKLLERVGLENRAKIGPCRPKM